MSELMNARNEGGYIREQLLAGVCTIALFTALSAMGAAKAGDEQDHPSVWLELGGQLERVDSRQDPFAPPFTLLEPGPGPYSPISPAQAQRAPSNSYGAEGSLSFQPDGTDWRFSIGMRYGRSNNNKHIHQQSYGKTPNRKYASHPTQPPYVSYPRFADFKVKNNESHAIVDFQVGRDFGLGSFGRGSSSVITAGLRFAEFTSKTRVSIIARPNIFFRTLTPIPGKYLQIPTHNDYVASAFSQRSFRGVGPSLSWNGSTPLLGNSDRGEATFDWGMSAAVLFGRQKAQGAHQVDARHYNGKYQTVPPYGAEPIYFHATPHDRSRAVTVPNIGGFLGASFRYPNAKVSFGYRADFFFGAMDTGIDARHTVDRKFYGPFATVSIGLGG